MFYKIHTFPIMKMQLEAKLLERKKNRKNLENWVLCSRGVSSNMRRWKNFAFFDFPRRAAEDGRKSCFGVNFVALLIKKLLHFNSGPFLFW